MEQLDERIACDAAAAVLNEMKNIDYYHKYLKIMMLNEHVLNSNNNDTYYMS
jgi:hypothetical protein